MRPRSYYNPGGYIPEVHELNSGEGKIKKTTRRIFKSLRLRRKVNTNEGIVVPDVIKQMKSQKKFLKFLKFFKRKGTGVKDKESATCSTVSAELRFVKSNINIGYWSHVKEMFHDVFGECFGSISSTSNVCVLRIARNLQLFDNDRDNNKEDNTDEETDSESEMEMENTPAISIIKMCKDGTKDRTENETASKFENIEVPSGKTMTNIAGHIRKDGEDNTYSKNRERMETRVERGPVNCENSCERIQKLQIKIPESEITESKINNVIKDTVHFFSNDDYDEEIEVLYQQGIVSKTSENSKIKVSTVPINVMQKEVSKQERQRAQLPTENVDTKLTVRQRPKMSVAFTIPLYDVSGSERTITPKPREPSKELRLNRKSKFDIEHQQMLAAEKRLRFYQDRNRPVSARRERQKVNVINLEQLEIERKRALREHLRDKNEITATRKGILKNAQTEVSIISIHSSFMCSYIHRFLLNMAVYDVKLTKISNKRFDFYS